ncbi:hypothetical protein CLV59_110126 [Chitinophaga dinghuensis]|uniref:Uncharacterized protein n=1 Tax=Chitinophaga dinghuensis TaxID=1539050 RepID=A0A327VK51_9BACT|nr:hypothetical protein CLV59_110126 [Chitinophaga dinghuensis]
MGHASKEERQQLLITNQNVRIEQGGGFQGKYYRYLSFSTCI